MAQPAVDSTKKPKDSKPAKKVDMPDGALWSRIKGDWAQAYSVLAEIREEMRLFDAYYLANQWRGKRPDWMPRPVINYVSYIVDHKAPQVAQNTPSGVIMPNSQEDEEIAQAFDYASQYVTRFNHFDETVNDVVRAGLLLGTGIFKVYWDNTLKGGGKGHKWVGNVSIEDVDPGNIYPDPQAYEVEDCRYIIYAAPRDVAWIRDTFRVEVDPETNLMQNQTDYRPVANKSNRAMMYEYWYREKGKINVIYAANGKILDKKEDVYKHGRYPFVLFRPKKNRKSFWGIGEPKNIIANQDIINQLVEMQVQNSKLTANPIALVRAGSGIDPNQWINKPGIVQPTQNPNEDVKWLIPPSISADVPRLQEAIISLTEKIGGVFDAATGNTPTGITAASAIQMLQEQGSIPLKDITRNLHRSVREVYELIIELIKEFYTETRYIRVMGDDGQRQYVQFKGSNNAEIDLDVIVDAGNSTPMSKAYLSQLAGDMFKAGVIKPSDYLNIAGDGLPDKDRMVQELRDKEAAPPAPPAPQQPSGGPAPDGQMPPGAPAPGMPPMAPPDAGMPQQGMPPAPQQPMPPQQSGNPAIDMLNHLMDDPNTPPELKQRVDMLSKQGASPEQIAQMLMPKQ